MDLIFYKFFKSIARALYLVFLQKMIDTGLAPTILEVKLRFLREVRLRDEVIIQTEFLSYKGKIGVILQKMVRGTEVCCHAEFTIGLFDLKARKMVSPTPEWLAAIGMSELHS